MPYLHNVNWDGSETCVAVLDKVFTIEAGRVSMPDHYAAHLLDNPSGHRGWEPYQEVIDLRSPDPGPAPDAGGEEPEDVAPRKKGAK